MTHQTTDHSVPVNRLRQEAEGHKAEVELLAESYDESTTLSWLWAFLFGPMYFLAHGFWERAILILFLNCIIVGFFVAPFIAYPAWRARARARAEKMIVLDTVRRR